MSFSMCESMAGIRKNVSEGTPVTRSIMDLLGFPQPLFQTHRPELLDRPLHVIPLHARPALHKLLRDHGRRRRDINENPHANQMLEGLPAITHEKKSIRLISILLGGERK